MLRIFRDDGWEYRWGDFGTTDGGVLHPIRHPGLVPGPWLALGPRLVPGSFQTGGDAQTTHQTVIPDLFRDLSTRRYLKKRK